MNENKKKPEETKACKYWNKGFCKKKEKYMIIAKKFVNCTSMVENAMTKVARKDSYILVNTSIRMGAIETRRGRPR